MSYRLSFKHSYLHKFSQSHYHTHTHSHILTPHSLFTFSNRFKRAQFSKKFSLRHLSSCFSLLKTRLIKHQRRCDESTIFCDESSFLCDKGVRWEWSFWFPVLISIAALRCIVERHLHILLWKKNEYNNKIVFGLILKCKQL